MIRTEDDVRAEVARKIRWQPDADVWEHVKEKGFIADVVNEIDEQGAREALDFLVSEVKELEEFSRKKRTAAHPSAAKPLRGESAAVGKAVARIMAAEAARLPRVREFRERVLHGRLLEPAEIAPWVRRQEEAQGEPTWFVTAPAGAKKPRSTRVLGPYPPGLGWRQEKMLLSFQAYEGRRVMLERVQIRADGVLGHLKSVALLLTQKSAWVEDDAVTFVLSGKPPIGGMGAVRVRNERASMADRVVLELSPLTTRRLVVKHYSRLQSQLRPRQRSLSDKHAELAAFIVEHNDGRPWREAMANWNRRRRSHPDEHYKDVRPFSRDARQAYQRLTGDELEWRGRSRKGLQDRF